MKRQLHVLWLVVACCNMSLAQSGLECKDKEYAYFEKDASGRLVQKCSSSTQPNVARVKQQMPLYMCVDDAYINPLSSSIHRNICDITNFASNFIDALEAAMAQWNAICPGGEVDFQYSSGPCMGEIEAVLNPDAWYSIYYSKPLSERYDYAETWPGAKAANGHDYAPRIYMNFTRELSTDLYQPQYTTWGRMWAFSGQCSPDGNQLKCDVSEKENKVCISVETVLLHELGHMLGLAHPRSNGCNGSIPSIMTSNTNLGESFNQSVQLADKCAIRNIYCPDALTSFDDLSRPANMVEVYPNPTKSGVMLEYPRSWQVKRIIVYNELGEVTTKIWVNNHEVPTFITEKCFSRGINYIVLAKDDMCVVKEVWVR